MAKKRISQDTFDEVVTENVEDFEMEPAAALAEAIKQFESQGVDLKNIDLSGGVGKVEMDKALSSLKIFAKNNVAFSAHTNSDVEQYNTSQQVSILKELLDYCDAKCEQRSRNREMMNPEGLNALLELLIPEQNDEVLVSTMTLLTSLVKNEVELRDFFEPGGSLRLSKILSFQLQRLQALTESDTDSNNMIQCLNTLRYSLALARGVAKSENNKTMLARTGTMDIVATLITEYAPKAALGISGGENKWALLASDACVVMRALTVHDDLRREMSCALDNGKFFLGSAGLVAALMTAAAAFATVPTLAGHALGAAKNLITTEDAVKTMALHGAMTLPAEILAYSDAQPVLIKYCLGLMRNLCADDIRKDKLVGDGSMRLCVAAMSRDDNAGDATLMEHGAACLAAMSLRSPSNSYRIAETGAIEILVKAMRRHPNFGTFQRQCALCMRNIAARCTDLRGSMLDAGAEDVLRSAGRIQEAVDEAYAALRDLGCEVHKVKIGQDGTVEAAYEQFGEKKSAFKAVWDDNPAQIEEAVQREAHAPYEGGEGQGAMRPATKPGFADEEIGHYGEDDDLLGTSTNTTTTTATNATAASTYVPHWRDEVTAPCDHAHEHGPGCDH